MLDPIEKLILPNGSSVINMKKEFSKLIKFVEFLKQTNNGFQLYKAIDRLNILEEIVNVAKKGKLRNDFNKMKQSLYLKCKDWLTV